MSIIKCDLDPKTFLVWKYKDDNPTFGSQVIVSQTQQVILLASGKLVSILDPGPHTLETANIPVLKDYIKDKEEAFPFEIWFLNKKISLNLNGEQEHLLVVLIQLVSYQ